MAIILAWHFLKEDRTLQFQHGKRERVLIEPDITLRVKPPLVMCEHGLHGSIKPLDALYYAPGPIVCRVEHSGTIIQQDDKLCSTVRKVLWMADATKALHVFACTVAEKALLAEQKAGREPSKRSWQAIKVKRKWLEGNATNEELSAARSAAESAARSAARSAAESAARSAAWSAAWSAARSAARSAAWGAARSAARSAAESAARSAAWSAAWSAARSAAWSAAWSAFNDILEKQLLELSPSNGAG
jgi:hypothetical protein